MRFLRLNADLIAPLSLSLLLACSVDGSNAANTSTSTGSGGAGGGSTTTAVPPNEPPVAVDDTATTFSETPVKISVLANDKDPNAGDSLSVISTTQPENGLVSIDAGEKKVTYTPDAGFEGNDTFTYTIQDSGSETDEGSVTVKVSAKPQIIITSPEANETVAGPNVPITFTVSGCSVSSPGANPDGCHVHKFLDNNTNGWEGGGEFGHYNTNGFSIGPVSDGSHNFTLVLIVNTGSDQPFEPEISGSVDFMVGGSSSGSGGGGGAGGGGN